MSNTVNEGGRRVDALLGQYASDHQNPTNQQIHAICVPVILWTTLALLWALPSPFPGMWAGLAMAAALIYYQRLSPVLGLAMLGVFLVLSAFTLGLDRTLGPVGLAGVAVVAFVAAWIAQFVGHGIEGKRPSFFTDLTYLLVGPLWVVAKGLRKFDISY